jgi:hypothetical protein
MLDKARLGTRYVCYACGTKFYDLGKAVPNCPECNADQREAPVRDIKSLLSTGRGRKRADTDVDELEEDDLDDELGGADDEDGDEDDEIGLGLGDDEEEESGAEEMD